MIRRLTYQHAPDRCEVTHEFGPVYVLQFENGTEKAVNAHWLTLRMSRLQHEGRPEVNGWHNAVKRVCQIAQTNLML